MHVLKHFLFGVTLKWQQVWLNFLNTCLPLRTTIFWILKHCLIVTIQFLLLLHVLFHLLLVFQDLLGCKFEYVCIRQSVLTHRSQKIYTLLLILHQQASRMPEFSRTFSLSLASAFYCSSFKAYCFSLSSSLSFLPFSFFLSGDYFLLILSYIIMLIFLLVSLIVCQKSPLQIGAQPFQLTLDTLTPMQFTLRVYLSSPFTIIMHIKNQGPWQPDGNYYLQFKSTNGSLLQFSQMTMQGGSLSAQAGQFTELSTQNAQTYDQYRFKYVSTGSTFALVAQQFYLIHVYRDPSPDLNTFLELRNSYLHTFMSNSASMALFPANLYQFEDIVEGTVQITPKIFISAIDYKSKATLFLAFLFNVTGSPSFISLDGGLSFSRSHIYRDMLQIVIQKTGSISIIDSFSLLAGAPYSDTSTNIGGQDNLNRILMIQKTNYILMMFSRPFDTGDTLGDQAITKKTNLQYCLALNTKHLNSSTSSFNGLKHNFVKCLNPNINLSNYRQILILLLILCMF